MSGTCSSQLGYKWGLPKVEGSEGANLRVKLMDDEGDEKYNDGWFLGQNTTSGRIGLFPESKHN